MRIGKSGAIIIWFVLLTTIACEAQEVVQPRSFLSYVEQRDIIRIKNAQLPKGYSFYVPYALGKPSIIESAITKGFDLVFMYLVCKEQPSSEIQSQLLSKLRARGELVMTNFLLSPKCTTSLHMAPDHIEQYENVEREYNTFFTRFSVGFFSITKKEYAFLDSLSTLPMIDPFWGAKIKNTICTTLYYRGETQLSSKCYEEVLPIFESMGGKDNPYYAIVASNMEMANHLISKNKQVVNTLHRYYNLLQKARGEYDNLTIQVLHNLAYHYYEQGNYPVAENLYLKALSARNKNQIESIEVAESLNNLGVLYLSMGGGNKSRTTYPLSENEYYAKAKSYLMDAINMYSQTTPHNNQDHLFILQAKINLGNVFLMQRNFPRSKQLLLAQLEILDNKYRDENKLISKNKLYLQLTHLYRRLENKDSTFIFLKKAKQLIKQHIVLNYPIYAKILLEELSIQHQWEGKIEITLLKQVTEILYKIIFEQLPYLSFNERKYWLEDNLELVRSWWLSLPADQLANHYSFLLQVKGVLTEGLRWPIEKIQQEKPDEWNTYSEIKKQLESVYRGQKTIPDSDLNQLQTEYQQRERTLLIEYQLQDPLGAKPIEQLTSVIKPDELLIDLYKFRQWKNGDLDEERILAVFVRKDNIHVSDLGDAALLDSLATDVQKSIGDGQHKLNQKAWEQLSEKIWLAAKPHLTGIRHIWYAPDDLLYLLPLPSPAEHITVSYIDSPRALVRLRRGTMVTPTGSQSRPHITLVGNVYYGKGSGKWPQLRYTKYEISDIEKLFPTFKPINLSHENATKTALLRALSQSTLAHIATHGLFGKLAPPTHYNDTGRGVVTENEECTELACGQLLMAYVNERPEDPEVVLGAEELVLLDLSALNLLVFSACDTAMGAPLSIGQGMLGLTTAAMLGGAKRVIAPLWKVDDEATYLFMKAFYKALVVKKASTTQSLLYAQSFLKKHPKFHDPYYWSGWILLGEPSNPIDE